MENKLNKKNDVLIFIHAQKSEILKRYNAVSLEDVDFVPPAMPYVSNAAQLFMIEDNDAVIKMLSKGRAPILKHCSRTRTYGTILGHHTKTQY